MTNIAPGWYRDPADPTTQRYWDGEGWLGEPIAADATPPDGPPPTPPPAPTPAATPAGAGSRELAPAGTHPSTATRPLDTRGRGPGGRDPRAAESLEGRGVPPAWVSNRPGAPLRPHGLALASAGSRLGARVIDILAVFVLCVVANAWFGYQFWLAMQPALQELWRRVLTNDPSTEPLPEPSQDVSTLTFLMLFVIVAVWFAYEVPGTANSGQTLGKRLMHIQVMRMENEERLGFGRSWRRWSRLGIPTLLWPCCFIGVGLQVLDCVSVATDRTLRQALHDRTAATVVVQVAKAPSHRRAADADRRAKKDKKKSKDNAVAGGRDADSPKS